LIAEKNEKGQLILQYAGSIVLKVACVIIPNECEGSKKDFSLPLEMTRERYGYFHHRDKVSACTAMPQRHPCHAEQSEASRIFFGCYKVEILRLYLRMTLRHAVSKGEEVNTVDEIKREQSMI